MPAARDARGRFVKGSGVQRKGEGAVKGIRGGDTLRALLRERIPEIGTMRVTVGVQASEAGTPDPQDGTVTVLTKAIANEFGVRTDDGAVRVPERSFLRAALDRRRIEWATETRKVAKAALRGVLTVPVGANRIGNVLRGDVQQQITDSVPPLVQKNADATIAAKGSSHPLIDTGQLRQSIRYRAEVEGADVGVG